MFSFVEVDIVLVINLVSEENCMEAKAIFTKDTYVAGNYTCVSDTHTATVLLVVTVREEADTGPEGLMTVNTAAETTRLLCWLYVVLLHFV